MISPEDGVTHGGVISNHAHKPMNSIQPAICGGWACNNWANRCTRYSVRKVQVPWMEHGSSVPHSPVRRLLERSSSRRDVNPQRPSGIEPTKRRAPKAGKQCWVDMWQHLTKQASPANVGPSITCTPCRRENGPHQWPPDYDRPPDQTHSCDHKQFSPELVCPGRTIFHFRPMFTQQKIPLVYMLRWFAYSTRKTVARGGATSNPPNKTNISFSLPSLVAGQKERTN